MMGVTLPSFRVYQPESVRVVRFDALSRTALVLVEFPVDPIPGSKATRVDFSVDCYDVGSEPEAIRTALIYCIQHELDERLRVNGRLVRNPHPEAGPRDSWEERAA